MILAVRRVDESELPPTTFDLADPARREFLAVYRAELATAPRLILSEEGLGFRWWSPGELVDDMSPLDEEIAARAMT